MVSSGSRAIIVLLGKHTKYKSSDLTICNFGVPDGRVFAGADGPCTITVTNSGFSASATGTVQTFTPTALSAVDIPGETNNVDVSEDFAYVAAGSAGLQIIDIADRSAPRLVAALDTSGNANDVVVVGSTAFVADGPAGLQIIDISDPLHPQRLGGVDTPGDAQNVVVRGSLALVADGTTGLQIFNVRNLTAPRLLSTIATPDDAMGVDVNLKRDLAVVAAGTSGIHVIDVAKPANPTIIGSVGTGDARDVILDAEGRFAFVADHANSLTIVDLSNPRAPVIRATTDRNFGGLLVDVALVGQFIFGADDFFVNGVPIINVSTPSAPVSLPFLDFRPFGDDNRNGPADNGTGIAADSNFVYLTTDLNRLLIGQYLQIEDTAGIPPVVTITAPTAGDPLIEGQTVTVHVQATDDVRVASVQFLVNEKVVFTDTAEPFEFVLTVPTGGTDLILGARATDFGGNRGVAPKMSIPVIPDPLTTVVGTVTDPDGGPVRGVSVSIVPGRSRKTGVDGAFSIPNVPTILGDIVVQAVITHDGQTLQGHSLPITPIRGGITDVGNIVLHAVGKIVVAHDEWTLSNTGFASAPDARQFALNVASWFTGGAPGNFLVYSANFGLTESQLASTMNGAGHTWTVSTTVDFSLPNLLQYDAIFLAGNAADNQVLIDYVNAGGNVYLAGGTGIGGSAAEAARWNPFLHAFGLAFFGGSYNGIRGNTSITLRHPLFSDVSALYQNNGNSVRVLDPVNPNTAIPVSQSGQGLYGIFSPERPTTVVDVVVDPAGAPVRGALVQVIGTHTGRTNAEGTFSISNVSSIVGDIVVQATSRPAVGSLLSGSAGPISPVAGGITDVGMITMVAFQGFALRFDGIDDMVTFGTVPKVFQHTIEAWVKPASANEGVIVGQIAGPRALCSFGMMLWGGGSTLCYDLDPSGCNTANYICHESDTLGIWTHLAGTFDGNVGRLYVNGQLVNQKTGVSFTASDWMTVGALDLSGPGQFYQGEIDEIRLWDFPRSLEEIQDTMHRSLTGSEPGLVGYWQMDEGAGQQVEDSSSAGITGVLGSNANAQPSDPDWVQSQAPIQ
jgi:hypothetical protein